MTTTIFTKRNNKNNTMSTELHTSLFDKQMSTSYSQSMADLDAQLDTPTIHIYKRKEGRRFKTLLVLPLLDELSLEDFLSLLRHTFHCSAGMVIFKKDKPQKKGAATAASEAAAKKLSKTQVDASTAGYAVSLTGEHAEALKRLLISRRWYKADDIIMHG